jgi:hypothetical protein
LRVHLLPFFGNVGQNMGPFSVKISASPGAVLSGNQQLERRLKYQ